MSKGSDEQVEWVLKYNTDRYSSYSPDALDYIQDALLQDCPECYGSGLEDDCEAPCTHCYGEGYI